ncbi:MULTISPECIES: hypothetical protein [Methylomonas]|uniref:PEP-CTERM protein-sorting domain-containing protein n=1 Tax=Methylomonas koyamae TaxID=702114 RepID=A0A177P7T8_9GAMM|nr:hypothetical protein [Methylomonas koyamae]OAI26366.1 hypothetical protein A1355_18905 [Methylomonas koyamae]
MQVVKSLLLAGVVVLSAASVSAVQASTVLAPASATVINHSVADGSFQDVYSFAIDNAYSAYNLSGALSFQSIQTVVSLTSDFASPLVTSTTGVASASVELLDSSAALVATGSLSSFSSPSAPTLVSLPIPGFPSFYQALLTTFNTITLNNVPVIGAGNYFLKVQGLAFNSGTYTGSLSVSPIVPAAVPLPGAAWAFLTGLLGVLGVQRRRLLKA